MCIDNSMVKNQFYMNNFSLPTSRKVLSTFSIIYPIGFQVAQTVVHLDHFQVQASKRSVFGWGWGCFVYVHILKRGVWLLSKEEGFGVVFWAKWDPIWTKWGLQYFNVLSKYNCYDERNSFMIKWLNFFLPILEHFCSKFCLPTSSTYCPDGSHFAHS